MPLQLFLHLMLELRTNLFLQHAELVLARAPCGRHMSGRAAGRVSSAVEPLLSAEVQLPVWVWDGVFMVFAVMLVEGFCCSVVVF